MHKLAALGKMSFPIPAPRTFTPICGVYHTGHASAQHHSASWQLHTVKAAVTVAVVVALLAVAFLTAWTMICGAALPRPRCEAASWEVCFDDAQTGLRFRVEEYIT